MQDYAQTIPPQPSKDIALLPPGDRAVVVLNSKKAEQELRALIAKSAGIANVIDSAGRKEAHRAGMTLKNARVAIEKTGKAARDDANQFSKSVVAEEKRLIAIVEPEEARVFKLRDDFDAKAKAAKEEADRKEAARVQGIKVQIAGILNLPASSFGDSAAQLKETLDDLDALEITEALFAEFAGEAADAKATALLGLRDLLDKAQAAEAEAKRLEAERAELQRIQAEAAQQRQAEEARLKAEREKLDEERRQFMAERAKAQAERDAAEAAQQEADKLACDHAEALAQNAQFDLGVAMAADLLADAHDEALAINEAWAKPEIAYSIGGASIQPGESLVVVAAASATHLPSINDDVRVGIEMLCTVVHNLRALGLDNEDILVAVGEALEAIDAKEAA